jgi:hypothetical protein
MGRCARGEMEGLLAATVKALQDHQNNVLCVVDSQAALRGILSTKPRSGQCRAVRYDKIIRRVLPFRPHLAILNLWTPAHVGTAGNELADEAAQAATLLDPDPSLFISHTTVRRLVEFWILANWDNAWGESKTGDTLRRVDRSPHPSA